MSHLKLNIEKKLQLVINVKPMAFINTLSPSTFSGVPCQTHGLKWLWTHYISFFFDFPGHFEYFHHILKCDQG